MPSPSRRHLAGVALVSATLFRTSLALAHIFSVVMYYHFAFLAISIALFGVSASGVFAYVMSRRLARYATDDLMAVQSLIYAVCTIVALFWLVRLRVGMSFSPHNLRLMLTIYALAALPFFAGGLVCLCGDFALVVTGERRVLSRPDRRGWRLPDSDSAARSPRCPGRRRGFLGLVDRRSHPLRFVRAPQRNRSDWPGRPARADRRSAVRPRGLRRRRHKGAPGRPHSLQQVELVLQNRRA